MKNLDPVEAHGSDNISVDEFYNESLTVPLE